jgi:hypothetical protein
MPFLSTHNTEHSQLLALMEHFTSGTKTLSTDLRGTLMLEAQLQPPTSTEEALSSRMQSATIGVRDSRAIQQDCLTRSCYMGWVRTNASRDQNQGNVKRRKYEFRDCGFFETRRTTATSLSYHLASIASLIRFAFMKILSNITGKRAFWHLIL